MKSNEALAESDCKDRQYIEESIEEGHRRIDLEENGRSDVSSVEGM